MWEDPIVKEVRKVREAHAAKFHYNLHAIYQDLKRQERESNKRFITFPPKKFAPKIKKNSIMMG